MTNRESIQFKSILVIALVLGFLLLPGCGTNQDTPLPEQDPDDQGVEENVEEDYDAEPPEAGDDGEDTDPVANDSEEGETPGGSCTLPADENADESGGEVEELKVISDGNYLLALVTKETTLKTDYVPPDLKPVPGYMYPSYNMQLREEALQHLEDLWQAAAEDGVALSIRSAYRSYNTQKYLFNDYASRHGEEQANRFSARPGQSEHQLGTAVDFGGTAVDFKADFADTSQGKWLAENAHYHGFALSYPRGKEHITGYIFEPWHYRYIGVDHALAWRQSGLTLSEYLAGKPQYFE